MTQRTTPFPWSVWPLILILCAVMTALMLFLPKKTTDNLNQTLELAKERAIWFGLTENKIVAQPSLGKDGRLEYSTVCSFPYGAPNLDRSAAVIVCEEQTKIYYDDGQGTISLNPATLGSVPQLLQSMPPGSLLYTTVIEESAKIEQKIFWVDQGRLYPEIPK